MWLKHPKFQELLGRRLTKEDPENGYKRTKLSFLQIFLTDLLRHQSWHLDSGCLQLIKEGRHMFLKLEFKSESIVGSRKGKAKYHMGLFDADIAKMELKEAEYVSASSYSSQH